MNAIILALGGIRAACFAALAAVLLLVAGVQTWRLGNAQDAYTEYRDKMIAATAKASQAAATAREASLVAREAYLWKSSEADNAYEAGRQSAINAKNVLVADLESERVRLRNEWRGCESDRVREGQSIAGTPQGSDEQARERIEGASNLIGNADQADLTITWLQSELIATRELYGKCMVPKEK